MNNTVTPTPSLHLSRLIKAPISRVFVAWTTPAHIMKWMGGASCEVLSAEIDLRVGGGYRFAINSSACGNTGTSVVAGVYREIVPPTKLQFTWGWEDDATALGQPTLVTVELSEHGDATEVKLTHYGFSNQDSCDRHSHGWTASLERLEKVVAAETSPTLPKSGHFAWNELHANDPAAAAPFYTGVFGWQAIETPMGPMTYTMFKTGDKDVGGMMQNPHPSGGAKWIPYVAVENADAAAGMAKELGGQVVLPPFDYPGVGRIAILVDPQGAAIGIIQPPPCQA